MVSAKFNLPTAQAIQPTSSGRLEVRDVEGAMHQTDRSAAVVTPQTDNNYPHRQNGVKMARSLKSPLALPLHVYQPIKDWVGDNFGLGPGQI